MKTPNECAALAAIINAGFVRVAQGGEALFVSDAPRRLPPQARDAALTRLAREGYDARLTAEGLLALDWAEARWLQWRDDNAYAPVAAFPRRDAGWPAYSLAMLLALHPAPWESQPRDMLRSVVKAAFRPQTMPRTATALYAACAQRLRQHQALPSAAAGALWNDIRMQEGEPSA